jgi:hypothetical protein
MNLFNQVFGGAGELYLYGPDGKLKLIIDTPNHLVELDRIQNACSGPLAWINAATAQFREIADPTLRRLSVNFGIQYWQPDFQQVRRFA